MRKIEFAVNLKQFKQEKEIKRWQCKRGTQGARHKVRRQR
jgi:hypothetical protein